MNDLILTGNFGKEIVFDGSPYVLHRLEFGKMSATHGGRAVDEGTYTNYSARGVVLTGYIVAEGEDEDQREEFLRSARDFLCRATDPRYTFVLSRGGRHIRCRADGAPVFSTEAPMGQGDADKFVITALAKAPEFYSDAVSVSGDNTAGSVIFPITMTDEFVFGTISGGGALYLTNSGTLPAGCIITVVAEGELPAFKLTLEGSDKFIMFKKSIPEGSVVEIDTRPGQKTAYITVDGERINALPYLTADSSMFTIEPGRSAVIWESGGTKNRATIDATVIPLFCNM